jgi:spermidine synthase
VKLLIALVVATASGFIALSYEILWIRVYGFATEGEPQSFGFLLSAYLTGLALGALFARSYCQRTDTEKDGDPLFFVGLFFLIGNIAAFLVVPLTAELLSTRELEPEQLLPLFTLAAAGLGTGFPLLSHYAIPADEHAGTRLSYLYVGNILGSTIGSLATGLWLLDVLSLRVLNLGLVLVGTAMSCLLMAASSKEPQMRRAVGGCYALIAVAVLWSSPTVYHGLYEKLLYQDDYDAGTLFAHTVENRSGVVNMSDSGTVYGGGSYDGQMNIDPRPAQDTNRVLRAYMIPGFHPAPRDILMIGLGSGSWLEVLSHLDDVRSITVVEINSGYVEIMRRTPLVAPSVEHPKVEIVIDDGRRYLNHTTRSFDLIIQNTIVYWRAHAANLLSREYLELTAQHLSPGGMIYLNSTQSTAAQKTVATVFPYALRYQNMMIAGFDPVVWDAGRWKTAMETWTIQGRPVIDPVRDAGVLDRILAEDAWRGGPTWEDRALILGRSTDEAIITDDNMATEWWAFDTYP